MFAKVLARAPFIKNIDIDLATILKFLYNRQILSKSDFDYNYGVQKLSSPSNIYNIEYVSKLLLKYLNSSKKIVIYGDYDADGILSAYILYDFIYNVLGYKKVWVWLPNRFIDGYGLNSKNLQIISSFADVVISVDCGIKDYILVEKFRNKLNFIIIDHHTLPNNLPKAPIIHLQYRNSNFNKVSAGFTVLKFVSFFAKFVGLKNIQFVEDHIQKYFEYAAITLVTDVMPMINENRYLLRLTMQLMKSEDSNLDDNIYINNIQEGFFVGKFLRFIKNNQTFLSYKDFGFVIGPRLNAVGRIMDPNIAFSTVITPDFYKFSILDKVNSIRRNLIKNLSEKDFDVFFHEKNIILGYSRKLSEGLIGLIAGNYSKEFQKLSIFCTDDQEGNVKCSGRSPKSISIINILDNLQKKFDCFSKYGGHANAAGFSLQSSVSVQKFWNYVKNFSKDYKIVDTSYVLVDDILRPSELNINLITEFKKFEPFGPGNEEYKLVLWGNINSIKEVGANRLILTLSDFYDNSSIEVFLFKNNFTNLSIGSKVYVLGTITLTSTGKIIFFAQRFVDKIKLILN